jgi:hypothetical protein
VKSDRNSFWLAVAALILLLVVASLPPTVLAVEPPAVQSFDLTSAAPRAVEPTTADAIQRNYAHAWQSLASALEQNRADLLNEDFVGGARTQLQEAIRAQQQNGLSRHVTDHGHKVRVNFYSPDGSTIQATDTADLEIEYREGNRVLSSERVRASYIVLLTPAENSWKVRVLQELPPG